MSIQLPTTKAPDVKRTMNEVVGVMINEPETAGSRTPGGPGPGTFVINITEAAITQYNSSGSLSAAHQYRHVVPLEKLHERKEDGRTDGAIYT